MISLIFTDVYRKRNAETPRQSSEVIPRYRRTHRIARRSTRCISETNEECFD